MGQVRVCFPGAHWLGRDVTGVRRISEIRSLVKIPHRLCCAKVLSLNPGSRVMEAAGRPGPEPLARPRLEGEDSALRQGGQEGLVGHAPCTVPSWHCLCLLRKGKLFKMKFLVTEDLKSEKCLSPNTAP